MVAVYNGDPRAANCRIHDPQVCNSDGLDFELDDPPLLMVEGVHRYNQTDSSPAPSRSAAGIISAPSRISASIPAAR